MDFLDFFRPKWRHPDAKIRLAAVRKIEDQALLAKIAAEDVHLEVREAAVERLTDQALLAKIAAGDKGDRARMAAVERVFVQSLLEKIVVQGIDGDVRNFAAKRLTDQVQEALVRRALAGDISAVRQLTDQTLLAQIATQENAEDHPPPDDLPEELWMLMGNEDRAIRAEGLSKESTEAYRRAQAIRDAAFERLTDQALLAKIATQEKPFETCFYSVVADAVRRLTDQALLAEIAVAGTTVSMTATTRVTDQALLAKIATRAKGKDVRKAATQRVAELALLTKIAAEDEDVLVRAAAVGRLAQVEIGQAAERIVGRALIENGYRTNIIDTKTSASTYIQATSDNGKSALVHVKVALLPNFVPALSVEEERNIKSRASQLGYEAWEARVQLDSKFSLVGKIRWRVVSR